MKYFKGFCMFWWDFLVGDSVVLAIGGIAVLGIGYFMVEADMNVAAQLALPLTAAATIAVSLPKRH
jgi:hypothetical protein